MLPIICGVSTHSLIHSFTSSLGDFLCVCILPLALRIDHEAHSQVMNEGVGGDCEKLCHRKVNAFSVCACICIRHLCSLGSLTNRAHNYRLVLASLFLFVVVCVGQPDTKVPTHGGPNGHLSLRRKFAWPLTFLSVDPSSLDQCHTHAHKSTVCLE